MITSVTLHNLFSYEKGEFEFPRGVTLIEGWNRDDGTPEGSGKSAIINAACWVLFGKIPKDAKIDEVVREGQASGYGKVLLSNGTLITRSRKPNDLYYQLSGNKEERRGKDAKETQAHIEQLMGMGFETFCQSVYFPQNYEKKFITASETEKANIISEIQDLGAFTEARKVAAKRLTTEEALLEAFDQELIRLKAHVEGLEQSLHDNKGLLEEFQNEKAARLAELDCQVDRLRKSSSDLQAQLDGPSEEEFQEQERATLQRISEYERARDQIRAVLLEVRSQASERARLRLEIDRVVQEKARLQAELKKVEERRAQGSAEQIDNRQAAIEADLPPLEEALATLRARILSQQAIQDAHSKAKRRVKVLESEISQIDSERGGLEKEGLKLCPTCGAEMNRSHVDQHLKTLERRLDALRDERSELIREFGAISDQSPGELDAEAALLDQTIRKARKDLAVLQKERLEFNSLEIELKSLRERRASLDQSEKTLSEKIALIAVSDEEEFVTDLKQCEVALQEARHEETKLKRIVAEVREAKRTLEMQLRELSRLNQEREKEAQRAPTSIEKLIRSIREQHSEAQQKWHSRELERKAKSHQVARLEILKAGFTEVKQYVFKGILLELSKKANRYLGELFEVPVSIQFSNEDEEGEVSKIRVEVTLDGQPRPLGLYSGGQARRIQLAVDLALSDIVAARSQRSMDFRVFDEPFKDLSEISMERAVRLFESLRGSTVLIEHNSLVKSIVHHVVRVELENGVSRRTA